MPARSADDYVQMQAVAADIGGTIGSVSSADPVDLMQLTLLKTGAARRSRGSGKALPTPPRA